MTKFLNNRVINLQEIASRCLNCVKSTSYVHSSNFLSMEVPVLTFLSPNSRLLKFYNEKTTYFSKFVCTRIGATPELICISRCWCNERRICFALERLSLMRMHVCATPSGQHLVAICQWCALLLYYVRCLLRERFGLASWWLEYVFGYMRAWLGATHVKTHGYILISIQFFCTAYSSAIWFKHAAGWKYEMICAVDHFAIDSRMKWLLTPKEVILIGTYIRARQINSFFCMDANLCISFFITLHVACATRHSSGIIFPPLQHARRSLSLEINWQKTHFALCARVMQHKMQHCMLLYMAEGATQTSYHHLMQTRQPAHCERQRVTPLIYKYPQAKNKDVNSGKIPWRLNSNDFT